MPNSLSVIWAACRVKLKCLQWLRCKTTSKFSRYVDVLATTWCHRSAWMNLSPRYNLRPILWCWRKMILQTLAHSAHHSSFWPIEKTGAGRPGPYFSRLTNLNPAYDERINGSRLSQLFESSLRLVPCGSVPTCGLILKGAVVVTTARHAGVQVCTYRHLLDNPTKVALNAGGNLYGF